MAETTQGNPEIGMSEDSIDAAAQNVAQESPQIDQGSVDSFFTQLENQVNGGIQETTQVTQQNSGPQEVTHEQNAGPEQDVTPKKKNKHNWKKRYQDSSKEAVKLKEDIAGVKPFMPVLEAMKNDPGLVQHVRNYLQNGGAEAEAKTYTDQLGLGEDFVFDLQEAISDPNSDSGKLAQVYLGNIVNQRVGGMVQNAQKVTQEQQLIAQKAQQEAEFKKKHNMSDEDFIAFAEKAKERTLTLDDVNYLLNRDKANKNVAQSTKKDMLNQMKNVRNMPASASSANSVKTGNADESDALFDALAGLDGGVDNLFG